MRCEENPRSVEIKFGLSDGSASVLVQQNSSLEPTVAPRVMRTNTAPAAKPRNPGVEVDQLTTLEKFRRIIEAK